MIEMKSSATAHPPTTAKTPRPCAACGEPAGSLSQGTGRPVVRDRATGLYHHVACRPGTSSGAASAVFAAVL